MPSYGWTYLTVTWAMTTAVWRTSDDGVFASEVEMFRELGVTGWELTALRETGGSLVYYFKRARA